MNKLPLTEFAKSIIRKKDDISIAVDMTCGNGNDTLFLSGIADKVYAFDIQKKAIKNSERLLFEQHIKNVIFVNDSFVNVRKYVREADVFMYNLGYLPNGNKNIISTYDVTIKSLKEVLTILKDGGIVSIMCYNGHDGGKKETEEVEKLISTLNNKNYEVLKFDVINKVNPPILFIVVKK